MENYLHVYVFYLTTFISEDDILKSRVYFYKNACIASSANPAWIVQMIVLKKWYKQIFKDYLIIDSRLLIFQSTW